MRNDKFILKREAHAPRPQFDAEHTRRSRVIRHCAMINCPKPASANAWPNRVSLSVRTDKVAPREICPQVFGPSEKEPLSLRHDKVQDVTRWMAGSNERNAPILLSKSTDRVSTYNRVSLLVRTNNLDRSHIDRRRTLQKSDFVIPG